MGFKFTPESLVAVHGRLLDSPKLRYKNNTYKEPSNGSWAMHMPVVQFKVAKDLTSWGILNLTWTSKSPTKPPLANGDLPRISVALGKALGRTGITTSRTIGPKKVTVELDGDNYLFKLRNIFNNIAKDPCQLIFVILSDEAPSALYQQVKKLADVAYGIHTVCCLDTKVKDCKDANLGNMALKVNLKLKGINQTVDSPSLNLIKDKKTMVVGIDVTHPSPGSSSIAPSVAGMVASVDDHLGQWPGILRVQQGRKELVSDLKMMLESRLQLWKERNRCLPQNILVYRDGVSDGQYASVLSEELPHLRSACTKFYTNQKPPSFAIIIATKRHHTRFYATDSTGADKSGNPKAGTVVDRGVTDARNWDFFLQSHAALQGTARPAHYYVLLDEIFRKDQKAGPAANQLQMLTQSLCYTFGRATKAVSYCTPAYYADILCERARCYLSELYEDPNAHSTKTAEVLLKEQQDRVTVHGNLKDTMFYI